MATSALAMTARSRNTPCQSRHVSSDSERVDSTGFAFDVGRKIAPFVGEIARAMIAVTRTRVRDIQDATPYGGSVRAGCVRHEAVEEDYVPRVGLHRGERQSVRFERSPFLAEQSLLVPGRGDLQAAVFERGRVDTDHRGEKQGCMDAPARLLVLMELEPAAASQLEVDLVLEQHGFVTEDR